MGLSLMVPHKGFCFMVILGMDEGRELKKGLLSRVFSVWLVASQRGGEGEGGY